MNKHLIPYYQQRAAEYEKIYHKPERQSDLQEMTDWLQRCFSGLHLLEFACGTGYWTQLIAQTAASILATDVNDSVLDIARNKVYAGKNVTFAQKDLYDLDPSMGRGHLFGGFIWSHIPLAQLDHFIDHSLAMVPRGGSMIFIDNRFVEGSNLPITETDDEGNTFQTRILEDGSTHLILKNFPSPSFLHTKCQSKVTSMEFFQLKYYWGIKCIR